MDKEIPYGHCYCGCGGKTKIASKTSAKDRTKKGEPCRYIYNHQPRCKAGADHPNWKGGRTVHTHGYVLIMQPQHPRATRQGYVFEHILICEKALGKFLPPRSVVHHHNKNRADNKTRGNLVVCQDRGYHLLLHQRMEALEACGHADWRMCNYCHQYDAPGNLYIKHHAIFHKRCAHQRYLERRAA